MGTEDLHFYQVLIDTEAASAGRMLLGSAALRICLYFRCVSCKGLEIVKFTFHFYTLCMVSFWYHVFGF